MTHPGTALLSLFPILPLMPYRLAASAASGVFVYYKGVFIRQLYCFRAVYGRVRASLHSFPVCTHFHTDRLPVYFRQTTCTLLSSIVNLPGQSRTGNFFACISYRLTGFPSFCANCCALSPDNTLVILAPVPSPLVWPDTISGGSVRWNDYGFIELPLFWFMQNLCGMCLFPLLLSTSVP